MIICLTISKHSERGKKVLPLVDSNNPIQAFFGGSFSFFIGNLPLVSFVPKSRKQYFRANIAGKKTVVEDIENLCCIC